jgi:outer membrane protein assembly factor BamB
VILVLAGCVDSVALGKATDSGAQSTDDTGEHVGLAHAAAPIYVNTGESLYTWDIDAKTASWIGRFETLDGVGLSDMVDIAIDSEGALYGAIGTTLYRIDAEDARCEADRSLSTSGTGLTFAGDGRLVVAGGALVAVDLGTGVEEELVADGTWATSGDVVGVPEGTLEWSVRGDGGDTWVSVDPSLGVATERGAVGASSLWGVAYAEGTVFAFSGDGYVYTVDPATGAGTFVVDAALSFYGAATNPVTW